MGHHDHGMMPAENPLAVREEPNNGSCLHSSAAEARHRTSRRFWVPVLRVDGGNILSMLVATDGLRHASALNAVVKAGTARFSSGVIDLATDTDKDARAEVVGYADDLGIVWWTP